MTTECSEEFFCFFCGLLWIFSTWTNLFPSRINPRQSSVDLLWTFIRAKKNFWTFVEKKREKRTIVQIHYSHIIFKTSIRSKKLNIQQRKQSAVQAVHTCIDCWGSYFFFVEEDLEQSCGLSCWELICIICKIFATSLSRYAKITRVVEVIFGNGKLDQQELLERNTKSTQINSNIFFQ